MRNIPKTDYTGETTPIGGSIHENSPIAIHFCQSHQPLRQYDLDFSPVFQGISQKEIDWLVRLKGELFVPICTKDNWIGLFVILPKTTGSSFTEEEIRILCVLADQMVVALENARLFATLIKANQDLLRTQRAFEQANLELRQVDERKSAFIGVLTHEMRTPLANITISLHVLELMLKDQLNTDHSVQLEQIKNQVKEAKLLADDLIMLAAFINDQVELQLEKIDFIDVLKQSLLTLQETAREENLHFHLDVVGDMLPVRGDAKLLANAVYQLVSNAVKFTAENGSIWVSCWSTGTTLCLDVEDTGIGIPFGKEEKVWEAFSQLTADPMRRGVEGLGLGLALVRHIVQAHGGIVWMESEEGKGSIFGFDVPLAGPEYPLSTQVRARRAGRLARREILNEIDKNTEKI
jgi:signal transduction histidine kinase